MAKQVESIGKYKVQQQLARGGMGAVYTATHPTLDRTVIIKKLTLRGNADIRERFRREAQIMMDLRNDAIVDVYDHFREGSSYYIVLEYVDGPSLDQLIRQRRYLPDHVALTIVREVCRALAYAHSRNVVHRDIKPANILISRTGEVKLVDFGIATIHGDDESELTREGMTLGTPSYMAPEQFQNTRSVDRRADIYSLGVVLYESVTGKKPYPGSFSPEVIARIQKGRYDRPRRVNPKVSSFTNRLITRMLNPKPERRFHDLGRVMTRIGRRLRMAPQARGSELIRAYLDDESTAASPARRRRSGTYLVTAAAAVLIAGGALFVSRGYHRELFQPADYGVLQVTVRVLKGSAPMDASRLRGTLFLDQAPEIPEAPNGDLEFFPVPEEETDRFAVFRTQRRPIPAGDYRIKISNGTHLWWESLSVASVRERSSTTVAIPGSERVVTPVLAEFIESPRLPLTVNFTVRDRASGRLVTETTSVAVQIDGRWIPWGPRTAEFLITGGVYRFRFRAPNYREQVFSLAIAPHETHLMVDVGLIATE